MIQLYLTKIIPRLGGDPTLHSDVKLVIVFASINLESKIGQIGHGPPKPCQSCVSFVKIARQFFRQFAKMFFENHSLLRFRPEHSCIKLIAQNWKFGSFWSNQLSEELGKHVKKEPESHLPLKL